VHTYYVLDLSGPRGKTTLTGTVVGVDVDVAQKIWLMFQALGNIAFAYSYTIILIEIQVRKATSRRATARACNRWQIGYKVAKLVCDDGCRTH
jgi:hypothetical protein